MYAIGEIVLVVIGILIALAINNSNQNRVIEEKEQIYLNGLKEEFQISKLKLSELINVNQQNLSGAKQVLEHISNSNEPPTETQFSQLLFNTFVNDVTFNPNNSLLNEMINSGSLKDISNAGLRIRLTNWFSTLEQTSKQENDLGMRREKILDMFRTNEYSLRTIFDQASVTQDLGVPAGENYSSNLKLLNSAAFENNMLMFMLTSHATEKAHYEPLMQDINSILGFIENELE